MQIMIRAAAAAAVLALAAGGAQASTTVFSENFDSFGFNGGGGFVSTSDRFGSTYYAGAAAANGWTFTGDVFWAAAYPAFDDGALLLNERGGVAEAAHALSGLTVGQTYAVSFLYSGDNIPGGAWTLYADVGAANYATINGVTGAAGSNPGATAGFTFVAGAASETLRFRQASAYDASPIIDNILVTTVDAQPAPVPEPAAWALMIGGFGLAGAGLRRRKAIA